MSNHPGLHRGCPVIENNIMERELTISLSPHIHGRGSVSRCMWNVVIALIPALITAVWVFGASALLVTAVCVGVCLLTEWAIDRWLFRRPSTLGNGSALITGLLLAFNLPSILPWWIAAIGAVVAIGIGKMSFGGLGQNIWNPALVGRVFLLLSFPAAMTTWPVSVPGSIDGHSGATILTLLNENAIDGNSVDMLGMFVGQMNGSLGEVGALAIIIGGLWLLFTRTITWHIPVSVLASGAFFAWVFGGDPLLNLLSGGLLLGAIFMATDYVTSPMTHKAQIIYGILIGAITMVIRRFGSYPEGVSFAILLMNSFTPLLNRYFHPRALGERRKK